MWDKVKRVGDMWGKAKRVGRMWNKAKRVGHMTGDALIDVFNDFPVDFKLSLCIKTVSSIPISSGVQASVE